MDLKITHKEEVWQPQGKISVLKPDMFEIYPVYEYQIAEGAEGIDSYRFAKCITDKKAPVTGTYVAIYDNGYYNFISFRATSQEAGLTDSSSRVVIEKQVVGIGWEYVLAEGTGTFDSEVFERCLQKKKAPVSDRYVGVLMDGVYSFSVFQATAQEAGLVNPSTTVVITKYLADAETVFDDEETFQMATFAAVKQRGNDPLYLDEGNRWAEVVIGEAPVDLVMEDVQESVRAVDNWCKVTFNTIAGADGYEYLMYTVSGLSKENP